MKRKTPRTAEEIAEIFDRHHRTVYRVCWSFLKNSADAEDAVQDAFLALIRSSPELESEEHEKAWLIRTASNLCINMLRSPRRKTEPLDETLQAVGTADLPVGEVLDAVLALPE